MTEAEALAFLCELRDTAKNENIVLSSERFDRHTLGAWRTFDEWWRARRCFVSRLFEALRGFDVRVCVFIRPQDEYLLSGYKGRCTRPGPVAPMQVRYRNAYQADYHKSLSIWADTFGIDRVCVQKYFSGQRGTKGLQAIVDGLGLAHSVSLDATSLNRHVSPPDLATAELLRVVGALPVDRSTIQITKRFVMQRAQGAAFRDHAASCFDRATFRVPYTEDPAESNARIQETFFAGEEGLLFGREIRLQEEKLLPIDFPALSALILDSLAAAGFEGQARELSRSFDMQNMIVEAFKEDS